MSSIISSLGFVDDEDLRGLLTDNGFLHDFQVSDSREATSRQLEVVVATAPIPHMNGVAQRVITLLESQRPSEISQQLINKVAMGLEQQGCAIRRLDWSSSLQDAEITECISFLELQDPFLAEITENDFTLLQQLIVRCPQMTWISGADSPHAALVLGLARSVRNEIPGKMFRCLSLPSKFSSMMDTTAGAISNLTMSATKDDEFQLIDGMVNIPRILDSKPINDRISNTLADRNDQVEFMPIEKASGPQKLAIKTQGMLDSLCLETDDSGKDSLGDEDLEIKVKASGLK